MDIVLPLGKQSYKNNIELKYCLRSIEKHLKGYRNIYIVGELSEWIKNVIHVRVKDSCHLENKEKNIFNKVYTACQIPELSEDFLFFNDDHFLLQDIEADKFPFHHKGQMTDENRHKSESYLHTLNNTMKLFPGTNNFDTHCPIIYNKEKFLSLSPKWVPFGYCIKTYYCNTFGIKGEYYTDLKINARLDCCQIENLIKDRMYFSIGDGAFRGDISKALNVLYPNKSNHET